MHPPRHPLRHQTYEKKLIQYVFITLINPSPPPSIVYTIPPEQSFIIPIFLGCTNEQSNFEPGNTNCLRLFSASYTTATGTALALCSIGLLTTSRAHHVCCMLHRVTFHVILPTVSSLASFRTTDREEAQPIGLTCHASIIAGAAAIGTSMHP